MADVADRAQLILVAGLAIAVTLLALVLLLNTVIYTENLATRGTEAGGEEALAYRQTAVEGVGGVLVRENDAGYPDYGTVSDEVVEGVDRLDALLVQHHVSAATVAELSDLDLSEGERLQQTDDTRELRSQGGAAGWTLATGVEDARAFDVGADTSGTSVDEPAGAFNVSLTGDDGDRWSLSIYGDSDLTLAVHNGTQSGASTGVCSDALSGDSATVDLTAGTVNGEPCDAIQFGRGIDAPYDVEYVNGGVVTGTYNLTLNVSNSATVESTNFDAGGQPTTVDVVYDARFSLHYEDSRLLFADRVRVAPGEPS